MMSTFLKNLFRPYSNEYSKTEKKIAKYLLKINVEVSTKTIRELADEVGVSKTAIFDFVKKHGFAGFQDFKIAIAQNHDFSRETSAELVAFPEILTQDSAYTIAQKVIRFSESSIKDLINTFTEEQLTEILKLIHTSENLHFIGQGLSSVIALDSYHKFTRTKFNSNYVADYHMQLSHVAKLGEKDCVFLFSHSGESKEIVNLAKILKERNVNIIVLTGNEMGELARYAKITLVVDSVESFLESESLLSRTLYITMMDIIYIAVLYSDEDQNKDSLQNIRAALDYSKT